MGEELENGTPVNEVSVADHKSPQVASDVEEGELSSDSPQDESNNSDENNDWNDESMFNMTDKEILDKIPKNELKRLRALNETQREMEIMKLIENFEANKRRKELMKRVNERGTGQVPDVHEVDHNNRYKSSKWDTEEDVEDLMTLNDPVTMVKPIRSAKSAPKVTNMKNLESIDSKADDDFFKELDDLPKYVSNKEELNKMRLSRSKIVKALYMPYFKKLLIGAQVKANMGTADLNGYQVCKVIDITETQVPYKVENITTRKMLKVAVGKKETVVRIVYISNSPFDVDDYENWKMILDKYDIKPPTIQQMKHKQRQIEGCKHYHLSDNEVTNMVNEKKKYQSQPTNLAVKKTDIMKKIESAELANNKEELTKWSLELEALEEKCKQVISMRNSLAAGMIDVNKRNRKENLKFKFENSPTNDSNADSSRDGSEMADNPFKRMKSRPNLISKKKSKLESNDSDKNAGQDGASPEMLENCSMNELDADCQFGKSGKISKKGSMTTNETENLHDFDLNIDIIDF